MRREFVALGRQTFPLVSTAKFTISRQTQRTFCAIRRTRAEAAFGSAVVVANAATGASPSLILLSYQAGTLLGPFVVATTASPHPSKDWVAMLRPMVTKPFLLP